MHAEEVPATASRSGWRRAVAASAQEFGNQRQKRQQCTEEHDRPVDVETRQDQKQAERDQPEPAGQVTDSNTEQ